MALTNLFRPRINHADVSLCVLSLPDVTSDQNWFQIPSSMQPFISPDTFFLLNKSDLAVRPGAVNVDTGTNAWVASLRTGDGTMDFLTGLANVLRER
jgi:tRNA modification GTPase